MGRSVVEGDAHTRAYLLGQAREFCRLMCTTLLNDGMESARYTAEQLGPRMDALASGEAVVLSRFELPPGHALSAPGAGRPTDTLVIGEDNVVRET